MKYAGSIPALGAMKTKVALATAIVLTMILFGCGGSSNQKNTTEDSRSKIYPTTTKTYEVPTTSYLSLRDRTLSALYQAVPYLSQYDDNLVWGLLEATCKDLDASNGDFYAVGYSIVRAAQANDMPLDAGDAGSIMGAAVAGVCPRWISAAQDWSNS